MPRSNLSKNEVSALFNEVFGQLLNSSWPQIESSQMERSVTRNFVAPLIRDFLLNKGAFHLVLRSDGFLAPRPLIRHGMSFAPDVDISRLNQRILAIEVKILRDNDASGSLTKAIGQTFAYKALGYEKAIGLIFESRNRKARNLEEFINQMNSIDSDVKFIYAS
jgi:hypothetical protein